MYNKNGIQFLQLEKVFAFTEQESNYDLKPFEEIAEVIETKYGMLFMLSLVFASFPFSGCFCEDFENKYVYPQIERGNLNKYAISKIMTIMLVTVLTMMPMRLSTVIPFWRVWELQFW
ncbi:MAG: hypothetical protein KH275_14500 [Clostridiales bacterium]|nr:hypothetical protein [Clostridiales bacterium]